MGVSSSACCQKDSQNKKLIEHMSRIKSIRSLRNFLIEEIIRVNKLTGMFGKANTIFNTKRSEGMDKLEYTRFHYYINLGIVLLKIKNLIEESQLLQEEVKEEQSQPVISLSRKPSRATVKSNSSILITQNEYIPKEIKFEKCIGLVLNLLSTEDELDEEELKILSEEVEEKIC